MQRRRRTARVSLQVRGECAIADISRKGLSFSTEMRGAKLVKVSKTIPGPKVAHVSQLNLLKLAAGGHLGKFVIWMKSAFENLDEINGTFLTCLFVTWRRKFQRSILLVQDHGNCMSLRTSQSGWLRLSD